MKQPLTEPLKPADAPVLWREAMGIHPDCERAQPGHTAGCIVFYVVLAACMVCLIYGMLKGTR